MVRGMSPARRPNLNLHLALGFQTTSSPTDFSFTNCPRATSLTLENQVKIRPLPITDLARIATMEPSLRLHALRQVKSGGGSGSYEPTRRKLPDIVNRQAGVFPSRRTSWEQIESDISRLSKSDHEERMNKTAAKAIRRYCDEH